MFFHQIHNTVEWVPIGTHSSWYSIPCVKHKNKLEKTIDIMEKVISKSNAIKISFALETENGKDNAIKKLKSKKADYIVLNYANEEGAGCDVDTNHIYIYSKSGEYKEFNKNTKLRLAHKLIEYIINNEE